MLSIETHLQKVTEPTAKFKSQRGMPEPGSGDGDRSGLAGDRDLSQRTRHELLWWRASPLADN